MALQVRIQTGRQLMHVRGIHGPRDHVDVIVLETQELQLVRRVDASRPTEEEEVTRTVTRQPRRHRHSQAARAAHKHVGGIGTEELRGNKGDRLAGGKQLARRVAELQNHLADMLSGGETTNGLTHLLQREHLRRRRLRVNPPQYLRSALPSPRARPSREPSGPSSPVAGSTDPCRRTRTCRSRVARARRCGVAPWRPSCRSR